MVSLNFSWYDCNNHNNDNKNVEHVKSIFSLNIYITILKKYTTVLFIYISDTKTEKAKIVFQRHSSYIWQS